MYVRVCVCVSVCLYKHTIVCLYTTRSDHDFVMGPHPGMKGMYIAGTFGMCLHVYVYVCVFVQAYKRMHVLPVPHRNLTCRMRAFVLYTYIHISIYAHIFIQQEEDLDLHTYIHTYM